MKLYTIGHTKNYRKAFENCKVEAVRMIKCAGGYALQSIDDAQRLMQELGTEQIWSVWEMAECSEDSIEQADDGWWYYLKYDLEIIGEIK